MPQAFIQTLNGAPYNFVSLVVAEGFRLRGYELLPFAIEQIDSIPWHPEIPVVGSVATVGRALELLGVTWKPDTYPQELRPFLQRRVEVRTLGTVARSELPLFIKPKEEDKRFTGFVCHDIFDRRLGSLNRDLQVYVADPIDILTEYRCYMLGGNILSIARYRGPVDCFPNPKTVRAMVATYRHAPIAYGLDVGITRDGDTVLIEVNEPLSLGNYGLAPTLAAKMIAARWLELTGADYGEDAACLDSPSFMSN